MLTRNDATGHGNKRNYECGRRNRGLFDFLQGCRSPKGRRLLRLRDFLGKDSGPLYHPYRDDGCSSADFFSADRRQSYFQLIPERWLSDTVVLIDPDNGLETKTPYWKKRPEKYALYSDVANVAGRSSGKRAIIIVQFPLRNANLRRQGLSYRTQGLRKKISTWDVHWIAPKISRGRIGDIAFLILTPAVGHKGMREFLVDYGKRHQMVVSGKQRRDPAGLQL